MDLYRQMSNIFLEKNFMISGYSLESVLTMVTLDLLKFYLYSSVQLYLGAGNSTRQEMRKLLPFPDAENLINTQKFINKMIENPDKKFTFEKSNHLCVDQKFTVKKEFKTLMEKSLGSNILMVNFSDPLASARLDS